MRGFESHVFRGKEKLFFGCNKCCIFFYRFFKNRVCLWLLCCILFRKRMQRNNGAGGSLRNLIITVVEHFIVSFCVSIEKIGKITAQFCIKIYLNHNIQRHLWFDEILSFKKCFLQNHYSPNQMILRIWNPFIQFTFLGF